MAVGVSLKGKFEEFGFFLSQIGDATKAIELKHMTQDYPINLELEKLNYFFSAFLNAIQSLKDACQTAMDIKLSWKTLSPNYAEFIRYCRNAATHDGSHLVNAFRGTKNYVAGTLRRLDNHGKVVTLIPPKEEVLILCCNISKEIMTSLQGALTQHGAKIPLAAPADFDHGLDSFLQADFAPQVIKNLIHANRMTINASAKTFPPIDPAGRALAVISTVENLVDNLRKQATP